MSAREGNGSVDGESKSKFSREENYILTRNLRAVRNQFSESIGLLLEHGDRAQYRVEENRASPLDALAFYRRSLRELGVEMRFVLQQTDPSGASKALRFLSPGQTLEQRWAELEELLPQERGTADRDLVRHTHFVTDLAKMTADEAKRFDPLQPQSEYLEEALNSLIDQRVTAGLGLPENQDAGLRRVNGRFEVHDFSKPVMEVVPLPRSPLPGPAPYVPAPEPEPSFRRTVYAHLPDFAWKAAAAAIAARIHFQDWREKRRGQKAR